MRHLLKPLVMILAVPVLATALGVLSRSQWEGRWTAGLARQLSVQRVRPDDRLLARYSLASLCSDRRTAARNPWCRTYTFHSALIQAAVGVGAAGFAFLGGLLLMARLCRASRRRMARLFRPSIVFAASGTSVLAMANALVAVAGVAAGSTLLFGRPVERVSPSLVLVAGTAAVVWTIAVWVVAFNLIRRPTLTIVGHVLTPSAQGPLMDQVKRVADAVGAAAPRNVVACLAPWVAVTELRVATLNGTVSGRTLCLSLPLCRILSTDEFRALLAHELAHFSKEEAGFSQRVAPFHAGVVRALERIKERSHGIRNLAVAPPAALVGFFVDALQDDATSDARREGRADEAAVAFAGANALASALVKAHAFAPAWDAVVAAMERAVRSGTQYVNASALFHEVVTAHAGPERLRGLGPQALGHPTDRHPSLAVRLDAIRADRSQLAASALMTTPESPAIGLVQEADALEQGLSTAEHRLIAGTY
jgi:Zn-dependent protease with chaperone function